jgi:hypothetical protein
MVISHASIIPAAAKSPKSRTSAMRELASARKPTACRQRREQAGERHRRHGFTGLTPPCCGVCRRVRPAHLLVVQENVHRVAIATTRISVWQRRAHNRERAGR